MYDLHSSKSLKYIIGYYHNVMGTMVSHDASVMISFAQPSVKQVPSKLFITQVNRLVSELAALKIDAFFNPDTQSLTLYTSNSEFIKEMKEMFRITRPQDDHDLQVTYGKVANAVIKGGRILFRGDSREPAVVFDNGMQPKLNASENDSVVRDSFVSEEGLIIALTPYLNTAAIFPINDYWEESCTWVYMTHLDKGLSIAPHSMALKEDDSGGAASYPAEVITHCIPPENIICAIKVKRYWQAGSKPAFSQPPGYFTIEELRLNNKCTVDLTNITMTEYMKHLHELKDHKTQIPFKLSENNQKPLRFSLGTDDIQNGNSTKNKPKQ